MIYNPFDDGDDNGGTVFRDVIMLALMGFVVIVILLLPHLNPSKLDESINAKPPGNVIIEILWPNGDTDVDLWVQGPGDVPVGYSNKGGRYFNLLRDDLGKTADATNINYENAYSRGISAGEHIVNVHLYRNLAGVYPMPVRVVVSVRKVDGASARQILTSDVNLTREGQEITVFRFRLNIDGNLVPGSVHNLSTPLREKKSPRAQFIE